MEYPEDSPEGTRVRLELESMKRGAALLGALQSGVAVDFEAMAAEPQPEFERIGLMAMWRRISKANG